MHVYIGYMLAHNVRDCDLRACVLCVMTRTASICGCVYTCVCWCTFVYCVHKCVCVPACVHACVRVCVCARACVMRMTPSIDPVMDSLVDNGRGSVNTSSPPTRHKTFV